ncbi:putative wall-associated receptor kinase-like 16 [Carex littledalei]|uniref:Putative wall-associated receptor kinase-like 16 n=1 Tax=Carex littledalei TaxID=544730 RepID=A0A833RA99_9POAL|nr:putative wall-associated receptor kinase-like 16 [Carex littledalei]
MNRTIGNTLKVVRTISTVVATILILAVQLECTDSVYPIALPGCQDSCGDIPIPYPFGIGSDCSMSEYFNITCDILNDGKPMPQYEGFVILNINLPLGQGRISSPISYRCYNSTTKKEYIHGGINFLQSPYRVNTEKNTFTVIGCNTLAYLCLDNSSESCLDFSTDYTVGCVSSCGSVDTLIKHGSCDGIGCCQTAMPKGTSSYSVSINKRPSYNNSELYNFSRCSYAMIVEEAEFKFNTTYITTDKLHDTTDQPLPMVIDWAIGNMTCDIAQKYKSSFACRSDHSDCLNSISVGGYLCNCSNGYQGNPYLPGGCQGLSFLSLLKPW